MVHLLKYGRVRTLSRPLGTLLVSALPPQQRFDLITAVPMHWLRRWQRGFNQSELLAAEVARRFGLKPARLVGRKKSTPPQAGMGRSQRRSNVAGVFDLRKGADVRGKRILLIDDVLTTGATVSSCAGVLKRAGAKYVAVLTLARADRRPTDAVASFEAISISESGSVIDA